MFTRIAVQYLRKGTLGPSLDVLGTLAGGPSSSSSLFSVESASTDLFSPKWSASLSE